MSDFEGATPAASGLTAELYARLRRPPSASSVPGSLPVLFFGSYPTARVATIGLNPSSREYTTAPSAAEPASRMLAGERQRLATLASLGAGSRPELTDAQCEEAIRWLQGYFGPGRPVYGYFASLERFLAGAGCSYRDGSAAHLNLVQEATFPAWRELDAMELAELRRLDLPFLRRQLEAGRFEAVFCNGRTAGETVRAELGAVPLAKGRLGRLRWWAGRAGPGGRELFVAGWNIPLNQATGLDAEGERAFGRLLGDLAGG